ncbi:MAG TPA: HEAT repeat domain-containing protein [Candidatus Saccharimonadales bacterium]|nr:HEAT repeat domain-containing protein [Candidatus Saccharimonadales bacterium]
MRPHRANSFSKSALKLSFSSSLSWQSVGYAFGLVLSLALPGFNHAASAASFSQSVGAIRAVGPEGAGNAAATAAWRELAKGNVSTVLPILEAMDGGNDYALNWFRAAVDSIVSRELAAGKKLPLAQLKTFLADERHNPKARRLAFELLARVEPAQSEKLLGGMLNDPSLEIRYDAVESAVRRGVQSLSASNKAEALALFQKALSSARDAGQIEALAKKLKDLGSPVDLQKLFGFLVDWKVVGPFDNSGQRGFEIVYPPEKEINLAAEYDGKKGKVKWMDYSSTHKYGMVDINRPCGKLKGVLAYATTDFFSDRDKPVQLRLGGKNSWKVWLNGEFLFGRDEYHTMAEIDQYTMPARLRKGKNTILVKVCQNEQVEEWTNEWEFQLRITDSLGTPIVSTGQAQAKTTAAATNGSLLN